MDKVALKRVITLIDMDCFYCQVELRLDPSLAGKPVAVVQYNQWKQGGIIAVNYEARDRGVTRFMRGEEAKKVCPELCLPSVPSVRGKADLTRYREAGVEVANVFSSFSDQVERASVDEAFIDLTSLVEKRIREKKVNLTPENLPSTFVVGHSDLKSNDLSAREKGTNEWIRHLRSDGDKRNPEYRLAVGALIVEEIRRQVLEKTGFHCSAGIGHNKILAKLVAGLHKPKCQTVIPHDNVSELFEDLPIRKVRNLGGKFGKQVGETLNISVMSQLYDFDLAELTEKFNAKNGSWLYNIARGIDYDPVTPRLIAESIGCSKNFPGPVALTTKEKVQQWLKDMATEVVERLDKDQAENFRKAKLLTITFKQGGYSGSRSCALNNYKVDALARDAFEVLMKINQAAQESDSWCPPIEYLGLSASKFSSTRSTITNFWKDKGPVCGSRRNEPEPGPSHRQNGVPTEQIHEPQSEQIENKVKCESGEVATITQVASQSSKSSIKAYFKGASSLSPKGIISLSSEQIDENPNKRKHDESPDNITKFKEDAKVLTNKLEVVSTTAAFTKTDESPGDQEFTRSEVIDSRTGPVSENQATRSEAREDMSDTSNDSCSSTCNAKTVKEASNSFFAKMIAQKLKDRKAPAAQSESPVTPLPELPREPTTYSEPTTSSIETLNDDLMQKCPECHKTFHLSEYLEHLDYHEALRVDKAWNGKIAVKTAQNAGRKSPKCKQHPAKKKRKIINYPIDQREITTFFPSLPK